MFLGDLAMSWVGSDYKDCMRVRQLASKIAIFLNFVPNLEA
jgi:hypothetical protein